jgi:predicted dehydrogenase
VSLHWGIIGAGKIAERQMATAMGQVSGQRLVAVMKRDMEQAQAFACRHGVANTCDSSAGLLADPDVQAVYVATPPHLHASQTIAAA